MKGCQMILLAPCIFLILFSAIQASDSRELPEQQLLNEILASASYDKRVRSPPGNGTGDPTIVEVNMMIRNIMTVDDLNMEWKLQVTLRQKWTDSRLTYNDRGGKFRYLTLSQPDLLWVPDLFIKNDKEGHLHDVVRPNMYFRIFPDGTVQHSKRLSLTLMCPMDLKLYPMDHQQCELKLASYGHTADDIVLLWKEMSPVQVTKNLYLPHFSLYKLSTDYCNSKTNTGTYSCLKLDLSFRRKFSHYLLTIYVPCTMFVIISYLIFFLNRKAVSARVTIATISIAMMSMGAAQLNQSMPPVSYTKAIDVWTGMCITFVFAALCECVLVNFLNPTSPDESPKFRNLGRLVDIVSRIAYPSAFLLFNIIYWPTYLNVDHQEEECGGHLQSCIRTGY